MDATDTSSGGNEQAWQSYLSQEAQTPNELVRELALVIAKRHFAAGYSAALRFAGSDDLVGQPLEVVEKHYILQALELAGGSREKAARMLGIGERTLYRKLKQWENAPPDDKEQSP